MQKMLNVIKPFSAQLKTQSSGTNKNSKHQPSYRLHSSQQDTVSFKAVSPELEKLLKKSTLKDSAALDDLLRDKIIPKTEDNIKKLAEEWHKRPHISQKSTIREALKDFWGVDVEKVKVN